MHFESNKTQIPLSILFNAIDCSCIWYIIKTKSGIEIVPSYVGETIIIHLINDSSIICCTARLLFWFNKTHNLTKIFAMNMIYEESGHIVKCSYQLDRLTKQLPYTQNIFNDNSINDNISPFYILDNTLNLKVTKQLITMQ